MMVDCVERGELLGLERNNDSKVAVFRKPRALMSDRKGPAESRVRRSEYDDCAAYCLRTGI